MGCNKIPVHSCLPPGVIVYSHACQNSPGAQPVLNLRQGYGMLRARSSDLLALFQTAFHLGLSFSSTMEMTRHNLLLQHGSPTFLALVTWQALSPTIRARFFKMLHLLQELSFTILRSCSVHRRPAIIEHQYIGQLSDTWVLMNHTCLSNLRV